MLRSPDVALAARLERIKKLTDDLARVYGGETSTARDLADYIKREIDSVHRALKRPKPSRRAGL